ncbi:MAG: hypothetical protein Q9186_005395 [Xanthomendoza sp. 1 TL-2023]
MVLRVESVPGSRQTLRPARPTDTSLALMGGSISGSSWDQQRREYCGREARVTNPANGKSMLLYIGDSFAHPRSDSAIDIVIGAFIELYGRDPNNNHDLVMNPVQWQLTGNVNPAYTVDGANFQTGDSGSTANTTETGPNVPTTLTTATRSKTATSSSTSSTGNLAGDKECDWGCFGETPVTVRADWRALIDQAEKNTPASFPEYKAPIPGTTDFSKCIDHTLLKLDATKEQVDELCEEARRHNFRYAVSAGALELDMVLNYPLLKQQQYSEVYADIAAVRNVASHPALLKVILETAQLTPFDIVAGCKIAEAANADFVKTSTGFGGQGATVENVHLMKSVIGPNMAVKASGGLKTVDDCLVMLKAGAERIGTSNGVGIMKEP